MPFALDNDAFTAWQKQHEWSESAWLSMMHAVASMPQLPLWALVPDVVADRAATLRRWQQYNSVVREFGFTPAFAVQDGMSEADIPPDAEVLFIGGTTEWKWQHLPRWCNLGRRVHVGRCNSLRRLLWCEHLGVESLDGTGWFRGTETSPQATALIRWVKGEASAFVPVTRARISTPT